MHVENKNALPNWDLTPIFPGYESPEFNEAFDRLGRMIDEAVVTFDRLGIDGDRAAGMNSGEVAGAFDGVIGLLSTIQECAETICGMWDDFCAGDRFDPAVDRLKLNEAAMADPRDHAVMRDRDDAAGD